MYMWEVKMQVCDINNFCTMREVEGESCCVCKKGDGCNLCNLREKGEDCAVCERGDVHNLCQSWYAALYEIILHCMLEWWWVHTVREVLTAQWVRSVGSRCVGTNSYIVCDRWWQHCVWEVMVAICLCARWCLHCIRELMTELCERELMVAHCERVVGCTMSEVKVALSVREVMTTLCVRGDDWTVVERW